MADEGSESPCTGRLGSNTSSHAGGFVWVDALRVGVAPQANKFTDVRGYTEG